MRSLSYLIFLIFTISLFSQELKKEKESRLKKDKVPEYMLECLQPYLSKKATFYREVDGNKKSYEAKLQYDGGKYSIEFDDSLKLEDVELSITIDQIDVNVKEKINAHLSHSQKFKILKIQKQFSSDKRNDREVIDEALKNKTGDIINYELEVGIKHKGKWKFFEMTFSDVGKFLFQREISERTSGYVLY
ncbi:hypothetical protein [Ekhidna sp.]|uniref:hypothetical protein n=1 Tax=Ekhidna sp. TaxID=2608089 RepID=UPI003CCC08F2